MKSLQQILRLVDPLPEGRHSREDIRTSDRARIAEREDTDLLTIRDERSSGVPATGSLAEFRERADVCVSHDPMKLSALSLGDD